MRVLRGFVLRWSVVGTGGALLAVSSAYSVVDNETILTDSAEALLPLVCALALVAFGYRLRRRAASDRWVGVVAVGALAGGLCFVAIVGWILTIQTFDGDTPVEPAYTLLNGGALGVVVGAVFANGYLRIREQRRELRERNRALEEFAGVVSHDLRNPLSVAVGHLELARQTGDAEHLETVESSLERMEALVEDLLELARQEGNESDPEPTEFVDLLDRCWETAAVDGGRLVVDMDRGITVEVDRSKLKQLFENLFRNSVEHGTGTDDTVTVTVGALDDGGGFYVADDGVGIPEEERAAVFEAGHSTNDRGTGLGLSIVERSAEHHGWKVALSESADGGARFEFRGVELRDDGTRPRGLSESGERIET